MGSSIDASRVVVTWPAEDVALWLDGRDVGGTVDDEPFNWEGFAFTTAARAREERSLSWANISLHVYGELAKSIPEPLTNTFQLSGMNLRSWMIRELGARQGDPVLDPDILVQWVRDCTQFSFEEVSRLASKDLRDIPIDTLRALRRIKHALGVLNNIIETPRVRDDAELQAWLRLRTRLP